MLLNQAKTIKEMQASHEGREALAWMQMHMPYRYYKAVRAMDDEITRLWAENEALREALKPFTCKCEHTTECLWAPVDFNKCANRRARAAYEGEK